MSEPEKQLVRVITGNGKGKTTSALGLAVLAAARGRKVFIAQFMKGRIYSEIMALMRFNDRIEIRQFGSGRFVNTRPSITEVQAARHGIGIAKTVIEAGEHDLVVLDEAAMAVRFGLLEESVLLEIISKKPPQVELVITGRSASPSIISMADHVLEMREVKHYYNQGVPARVGIEK